MIKSVRGNVPPARAVCGIVLLDKPAGMSSSAATLLVRRLYRARKAGHTGALDPLASGLLPVCLGESAKFAGFFLNGRKTYRATGRLGETTATGDAEGQTVRSRPIGDAVARLPEVLTRFCGKISQVPPLYSAVKIDGRPLYRYARRGLAPAVPPRTVEIFALRLLSCDGAEFTIEVDCSKGTYIRTLVTDLGEALGCGAYVTALRRLGVAGLPTDGSVDLPTLQRLAAAGDFTGLDRLLCPVAAALAFLPGVALTAAQGRALMCGQRLSWPAPPADPGSSASPAGVLRLTVGARFLGVGRWQDGQLTAERMLSREAVGGLAT